VSCGLNAGNLTLGTFSAYSSILNPGGSFIVSMVTSSEQPMLVVSQHNETSHETGSLKVVLVMI
jgi:hypothetical protein